MSICQEKSFNLKLSGNEVDFTNALLLLKIILCSKLQYQKVFNRNSFLIRSARKVGIRLPGKGNPNLLGAKPVHQITSMINRIRTSRLSMLSGYCSIARGLGMGLSLKVKPVSFPAARSYPSFWPRLRAKRDQHRKDQVHLGHSPQTTSHSNILLNDSRSAGRVSE